MKLIINKPKIENNRVVSLIEYDGNKKNMYFEVNERYIKYLNEDNVNSFLIALLPFIVKHNYDVEIKTNISSKIYYQLTTYLLPLLCKEFNKKEIKIDCSLSNKKYNGTGVGASISCGVDSFYTLLKHRNCEDKNNNITHLCFFNAGSNGEYGGDEAKKLYNIRVSHIKEFCKKYNYPLINIDSNLNEIIMMNHQCRNTFTTLACVFVLEKLFSTYYFASCFGFNGSHIDDYDTTYYDILNVHCLSNENISFYCSGMETTRIEKLKFISNEKITYDWLNVCVGGKSWNNCGMCNKCIRTLTELESIGKLNLYSNIFDLNLFYKNRAKIYSKILIENKDKVNHEFYQEIIDECKKNNVKIPLISKIIAIFSFKSNVKILLKNNLSKNRINMIKKIFNKKISNDGWE